MPSRAWTSGDGGESSFLREQALDFDQDVGSSSSVPAQHVVRERRELG